MSTEAIEVGDRVQALDDWEGASIAGRFGTVSQAVFQSPTVQVRFDAEFPVSGRESVYRTWYMPPTLLARINAPDDRATTIAEFFRKCQQLCATPNA